MARRRTLQSRTSFFPLGFSPEYESRSSTQYALKTARCEKSIPALAFCWVWLFLVFPLQVAAEEVILDKVVRFDILEQRADLSLTQFAEQANLTLLFPPDGMGEVIANALVGEFSVADGMQILLAGTGLKPTFSNRLVLSIALESNSNHGETDMIQRQKSKGGFLAAVAALFTAYGAHAENSESTDAAQSERVIEEILVTATKRNTTVQDTPLSVTAFSTDDLYAQGIENFEDFSRQTPGVLLTGGKNFQKFSIRGIQTTSSISSIGEQKPVAIYYDEVPVSSFAVVTPDLRLYDVERVEVLRGPQGTTFGSGSIAGAVRVLFNKATVDQFDSSIRVEAGSTRDGGIRQRYSGMVNLPLTDTAAIRLVGYARDEEGFIDNQGTFDLGEVEDENESDEWGLRASLRWMLTDSATLTFNAMHDESDAQSLGEFQQPALGDQQRATFRTEAVDLETQQFNLTYEHNLSWGQLVSSTTFANNDHYWDLDLDAIFGGFMPFAYNERQSQEALVQELRLVSSLGGRFEWLAGAFYMDRETDYIGASYSTSEFLDTWGITYGDLPPNQISPGVEFDVVAGVRNNQESALFGELIYQVSDTVSISAGIRYSGTEFEVRDTAEGQQTDAFGLIFGFVGGNMSWTPKSPQSLSTGRESSVTTRFSARWEPDEDRTFYLTAAEGFRRPHPNIASRSVSQVNPGDPTVIPSSADSDELWSYEAGAKLRFLDGQLQANLAAYFIDWQDIQLGNTRPSDAVPYTSNGGDVESKGLELELLYYPTDHLDLGLNLTFADSEVVSITPLQEIQSGQVKGEPLTAPDRKVSVFAEYNRPLGQGRALFSRLDVQYVDEYPNAPGNLPGSPDRAPNPNFAYTDAYENVNLQFGWRNERVRIALYAENLLDNDDFIYINPDLFSLNRYRTLRPRTLGLRIDWNYR